MARGRSSRRRRTRYFVRRSSGHDEIARISPQGAPSFYDAVTGSWIHDPLLGAEIRLSGDWTQVAADDLPPGATGATAPEAGAERRGRGPGGRHVQADPG
jgi:hypothetical protein